MIEILKLFHRIYKYGDQHLWTNNFFCQILLYERREIPLNTMKQQCCTIAVLAAFIAPPAGDVGICMVNR